MADEYPIEWPHQGKTIYHGTGGFEASVIADKGMQVPTSPSGRGNDFGLALYFTEDRETAEWYARGALVTAQLKPHARILDIAYAWSAGLIDRSYESFKGSWWKQYALDNGYHGITTEGEVIAIYDPSVLTLLSVKDLHGRGELLASKTSALGGPDAGSASDLKRTDLFWRVHDSDRPFEVADATSQPFITMTNPQGREPDEGYSAVRSPLTLLGYLVTMGWLSDTGGVVYDDDVIGFRGRVVGTGPDGENLVVPEGEPVYRASFHDFVEEFEHASMPRPTQDRISFLNWRLIVESLLTMQGYDSLAWTVGDALDIDVDDVAKDLWGPDYEMAMYGARTATYRQDGVPPAPGESPLPPGHIRLFHATWRSSIDSILRQGLTVGNSRGTSYGEPNLVWASSGTDYWSEADVETDKVLIEFSVPFEDVLDNFGVVGGPTSPSSPEAWMAMGGNIGMPFDIPTSRFLAVHEGWHNAYRSLVEYGRQPVLDGEYDDFLDGRTPEHAKAIERIKREGGATHEGGLRHEAFVPHRLIERAPHLDHHLPVGYYAKAGKAQGWRPTVWKYQVEAWPVEDDGLDMAVGGLRAYYDEADDGVTDGHWFADGIAAKAAVIEDVYVLPPHQRKGVATGMLAALRSYCPVPVKHNSELSPDGQAWSQAVGAREAVHSPHTEGLPEGYWGSRTAAKGDAQIVELDAADVTSTRVVAYVFDHGHVTMEGNIFMGPIDGQTYQLVGFLTFDTSTMTTELAWTDEDYRRMGVQRRLWQAAEQIAGGTLRPHGQHSPAGKGLAGAMYDGDIEDYQPLSQREADSMASRFLMGIGAGGHLLGEDRIKRVVVQRVASQREAMADRSGNPEVDRLIEDFLDQPMGNWTTDTAPIRTLIDPQRAAGVCTMVTEQFVEFAKTRGFKAYVTHTNLDEMGYTPTGEPQGEVLDADGNITMGWYEDHCVASIYVDGNRFPYYVDFTATQYGYTDLPKVTSSKQQREAAWSDVVKKAARIRQDGGVRILSTPEKGSSNQDWVIADVRGDTNVYRTELMRVAGSRSTALWRCGCAWAAYSWGRSGRWKKYEGRMCSHALAVQYEMQARTGFDGSQPAYEDPAPKDWGQGVTPQFEHPKPPLPADKGFV